MSYSYKTCEDLSCIGSSTHSIQPKLNSHCRLEGQEETALMLAVEDMKTVIMISDNHYSMH